MSDFRETLYTVDAQGNRRWVYSDLVQGFWFRRRVFVAYGLMAFYLLMPWLRINGRQGVLFDIPHRRFIFFGAEFWATDTLFLFLILSLAAFSLFFFTAVFGRVWCGWACPETVFLEFLFRPIERLIEGNASQRKRLDEAPWSFSKIRKKLLKHGLCAFFSWVLASTALAYFLGRETLLQMMTGSPLDNPIPFVLTLVMMGIMAFQFGWFREQFCTVLCPYARFQSVLMDSRSIIVGYDVPRGEPRGKVSKGAQDKEQGDCVDCKLCVRVCPTGIDIRNGLQLECVACTACVDACDSIMSKLGRKQGLIRYDTEDRLLGRSAKRNLMRPRPVVYGAIVSGLLVVLLFSLTTRQTAEFQVLRGAGVEPYTALSETRIANHVQIRVSNKGRKVDHFSFSVVPDSVEIIVPQQPFEVAPGEVKTSPAFLNFEKSSLPAAGSMRVEICVQGESGYQGSQEFTLLGPGE